MAKRRKFTPNLRLKLLLRPLAVRVHKRNSDVNITSAKNNSQGGNATSLITRRHSLNLLINRPMPINSELPNLSNSLAS